MGSAMHKLEQCHKNEAGKDSQEEQAPAESVLATIGLATELCRYQLTPSNKNESTCNDVVQFNRLFATPPGTPAREVGGVVKS